MKRNLVFAVLLAALCLAGCAAQAAHPSAMQLVQYQRMGGIAGLNDLLVIMPDGKAQLTQKGKLTEFTLDAAAVDQLKALFEQPGFMALQGEYVPANTCCDLMDYVVHYTVDEHTVKRVHTMDTAVPEELQPILTALSEIISSQGQ